MSETHIQLLNVFFSLASLPSTVLLVLGFIIGNKHMPSSGRAITVTRVFFFSVFFLIILSTLVISMLAMMGYDELALRYAILRTLFITSTWFVSSWALYFVHRRGY